VRCPQIVYGTAWKKEQTQALVRQAIECGFRGIDTAAQPKHYDEAGVGAAVRACIEAGLPRRELYVQTKFTPVAGQDPRRIPYDPKASLPEQVAQSCQSSLRNLRTDYVDCLVLHAPLSTVDQTLEVWRAMEAETDSGHALALGISNCYDLESLETLYRGARIPPSVVQNRLYADTSYDRDIRTFCRSHGLIYQSFWTLTANPHLLGHALVKGLAARYERTAEQILFRYLSQSDVVPLTGTRSLQHMRDDLAIFDFVIARDDCKSIDTLL
jgi:diketogulonate reductase-like aldo/keto reductase